MRDEEARASMSYQEMATVVENRARRYAGLRCVVDLEGQDGSIVIQRAEASHRWARIELGTEAFFLDVDSGFRLVDFEWGVHEQTQLLEEFVDVAHQYLAGDFIRRNERTIFGRQRHILAVTAPSGEEFILKEMSARKRSGPVGRG